MGTCRNLPTACKARSTSSSSRHSRGAPRTGTPSPDGSRCITGEVLVVGEGSLYPALHRLEEKRGGKRVADVATKRRTKVYELTTAGPSASSCRNGRMDEASWRR